MIGFRYREGLAGATVALLLGISPARGGEHLIIQLRDFSQTEVKSAGFTLPREMPVHITAVGAGEEGFPFSSGGMMAYGWILNAASREVEWKMDDHNTARTKSERTFDRSVTLPAGSYELYFSAYGIVGRTGLSGMHFNIDHRNDVQRKRDDRAQGFLDWLRELFGGDVMKDWKKRAVNWGIDIAIDDRAQGVMMFNPPREFPIVLYKATRIGENEHIRQQFELSRPMHIRIYALGESDFGGDLADYGWIVSAATHKRVWDMEQGNTRPAGGADKNVKYDGTVSFPAGQYILTYVSDDSHSFVDWNAPPPYDPFNYGITLIGENEKDKEFFKTVAAADEDKNVIVQLTRVGNSETRSGDFTLKKPARLRVYAIGERANARREMADYGWIIDSRTRERVWTMDVDRTEPAGGASKNRMIDEEVSLPKGSYTVFYQTDDSHAYNAWNDAPPYDPEHYGITVSGAGDDFSMSDISKNAAAQENGVIAQIVRVGDNAKLSQPFHLSKPMHVRVYALGEGQNREMYDYGWIENAGTGAVVWEMTYSMTFHAGGGRKNRMVSATILLDKGDYLLHYVSDDSHSYNHWNVDPPDDPTMWGITLYEEK